MDKMIQITGKMFETYVEKVALSFMYGEVPNTTFAIHRTGTKEKDYLCHVKFKNTLTISVFRCDVYIDDIMLLCRRCKMYLVTEEVYRVAVLYAMLCPLYQTQHMKFDSDVNIDYESMLVGAQRATYKFILHHHVFNSPFERKVLDIVHYNYSVYINNFSNLPQNINIRMYMDNLLEDYKLYMNRHHYLAYHTAIKYKAQTHYLDDEGFIVLERIDRKPKGEYSRNV